MHEVTFLQDLAIVMVVAGLVTVLFHRLKQPVVLGYVVAGVIIGPHTPPFPLISDQHTIQTLSELGIIFLMFSLGLEFTLRKLREVGATALIAALSAIVVMVWAGYWVGRAFGWGTMDCIFLGAILSISSTTIIVKALEDLGKTKEKFAALIFGILIVEDILAIVMIALLSGFATSGSFSATDVVLTVIRLGSFLVTLFVAGLIIVPRLLNYVAKFKSNEMLLVSVLGLCFGVSLLAVKLNYSVALGAFLIGTIVAEARQIGRIETLMTPVRDMFSAVFFVSIGLLINPELIWQHAMPILVITVVVILGKSITCSVGAFVAGNDMRTSLRVGMGLAQIGEFSFIIASLGLSLNVTSEFLYPVAVAVSGLTTVIAPYLIKSSDALVGVFDRTAPPLLKNYLDLYTRWVGALGQNGSGNVPFRFVRKLGRQIGLNLILVTAIFIAAAYFQRRFPAVWPHPLGGEGVKALLWLGAMLFSLPILIAIFRKMQALSMLLSEVSVTRSAAGGQTATLRAIVSNTILSLGCTSLVLLILMLSSTILPSWNVFLVLALIAIAGAILLRRSAIRIYAKAQIALRETLSQSPAPRHSTPSPALPSFLSASLRSIMISPDSPAAGRLIGELRLRSKTGASVVGIERDGSSVLNPGPDEELRPGDTMLLLGSSEQLRAAAAALLHAEQNSANSPPNDPA